MSNNVKWSWGSRLAAVIVLAAGVGSANAAVIRGNAEPQFTANGFLSGLSWASTIVFSVLDTCIPAPGNTGACSVTVSSVTAALAPSGTPLFPIPAGGLVLAGSIHTSSTTGLVDAFDLPSITSNTFNGASVYGSFQGTAAIDWGIGDNNLPTALLSINILHCGAVETDFAVHEKHSSSYNTCTVGAFTSTIPATISITQVPEPGTVLLLLVAISALGYVRRRVAVRR